MKKLRLLILALILPLQVFLSRAQGESSAPALKMVETYLNEARTFTADFEQIDNAGKLSHGKFYLSRPGKLRLQYTDPTPLTIVADGQFLIHHDSSTRETTTMALSETPAEFILRENIRFDEGIKVTQFQEEKNTYKVTLARSAVAETGTLTLKFSKKPLKLVQWIVIDSQGLDTTVNLTNLKTNVPIDQKSFIFQESIS
ncbi:MAG: outer membrane lipoprotein carrier protein LolA [Candidatus Paracaedimonas acanthamoebae]|uniref:Outer membrane lipoprotein carrier protein LolA n=1 Tax=Candidatus Paracaedimonas acanthamoebae TaxID=244581 RepID=A0A8J7PYB9_9PROT|nr:outer membrane lipoprotein carrier protein LolA [Candidatus Paracaedimonas acanthamoebae]